MVFKVVLIINESVDLSNMYGTELEIHGKMNYDTIHS